MEYDLEYYERTLRLNSGTAELINEIRWDWVKQARAKTVIDYGSGAGWFRAFRPSAIECDSYDIGVGPQTGITRDKYDLISLWDTLEHVVQIGVIRVILQQVEWAAVTVPILPAGKYLHTWKHYKIGEHVRYYTEQSLIDFFDNSGFKFVKGGNPECPPREDIFSALFRKG